MPIGRLRGKIIRLFSGFPFDTSNRDEFSILTPLPADQVIMGASMLERVFVNMPEIPHERQIVAKESQSRVHER